MTSERPASVMAVTVNTGFVAAGLEHGSSVVRWIIAVAMAYFLLVGVLAFFSLESAARWQGFWAITISIVVLALLLRNKDAKRYFADAGANSIECPGTEQSGLPTLVDLCSIWCPVLTT
jgi:hypothetical protein